MVAGRTIDKLRAWAKANEVEIVTADGLDDALVGVGQQFNKFLAIYSRSKCIEIFMRDGLSQEEAEEYFETNVVGAYVGEHTPVFITSTEIF
jgi:hypothetical protein